MDDNPYYRLSPFIQDFIYRNKWTQLRGIQVEACRVLFDSDDNLLLCSGTASGKTEAAFLPCLTLLEEQPSSSVGILYVSPLKALINDQFARLDALLEQARIPVHRWHGDVSQAAKQKLLKNPAGVLQITPESLESLLMNKKQAAAALFCDLRFVIIDEVHCFMSSDRGAQLLCQLERIQRLANVMPRRVGLSATLGEPGPAERWRCSGTPKKCQTPAVPPAGGSMRLYLEHFIVPDERRAPLKKRDAEKATEQLDAYYDYLYENTLARRCIVYANSRGETEETIAALKQAAKRHGTDDIYLIHHGSLSAAIREHAERAMKNAETPFVTGATVTLELGIDIGALERVVQIDSPHFVSSFLQRLGRTGRRGGAAEMWFACKQEPPLPNDSIIRQIDWSFLECLAVLQLYLEDRWVEPLSTPSLPMSLLYHQMMSIMASAGEISPAALAQRVLTLSPFRKVTQEDFRALLLHLLGIDHLERGERGERGGLLVGLAGERVINSFRFFAVFEAPEEYTVRHESEEIGTLQYRLPPGERFALAGRTWEVVEADTQNKVLYVKAVADRSRTEWVGLDGPVLHTRLLRKMRDVLRSREEYRYLGPQARQHLAELRAQAGATGLSARTVLPLGGDSFGVFPWLGTRALKTLGLCLTAEGLPPDEAQGREPYCLVVHAPDIGDVTVALETIARRPIHVDMLPLEKGEVAGKFNEFLPRELLLRQFRQDFLDPEGLKRDLEICM